MTVNAAMLKSKDRYMYIYIYLLPLNLTSSEINILLNQLSKIASKNVVPVLVPVLVSSYIKPAHSANV